MLLEGEYTLSESKIPELNDAIIASRGNLEVLWSGGLRIGRIKTDDAGHSRLMSLVVIRLQLELSITEVVPDAETGGAAGKEYKSAFAVSLIKFLMQTDRGNLVVLFEDIRALARVQVPHLECTVGRRAQKQRFVEEFQARYYCLLTLYTGNKFLARFQKRIPNYYFPVDATAR